MKDTGEEIDQDVEDMRIRHTMLLVTSVLQLLQCFAQSTLIAEASKRCCITRFQILAKPGRQVITFLLFSNCKFEQLCKFCQTSIFQRLNIHENFSNIVGIRYGNNSKLDISRTSITVFWCLGLGCNIENWSTTAYFLSISQLRTTFRSLE